MNTDHFQMNATSADLGCQLPFGSHAIPKHALFLEA